MVREGSAGFAPLLTPELVDKVGGQGNKLETSVCYFAKLGRERLLQIKV